MSARSYAALALAAALAGCTVPWKEDESHRIDEAMACARWDPQAPEARGIALFQAPPLAPPWKEGQQYQLSRAAGRKQRLGRVAPAPPRQKRTKQPAPAKDGRRFARR